MDDTGDMEIDPAIAEAMGFSAFGSGKKGNAKRKADHGFVDPAISANNEIQREQSNKKFAEARKLEKEHLVTDEAPTGAASSTNVARTNDGSEAKGEGDEDSHLRDLRNGVRNEEGHLAIFLPSFLEDPWKDLRSRKADSTVDTAEHSQCSWQRPANAAE